MLTHDTDATAAAMRADADYRARAGDLVQAREALWRVMHVRGGAGGACRLVQLRGADDRNRWQACTLLEPHDRLSPRTTHDRPRVVSRRLWMRAFGTLVASATRNLAGHARDASASPRANADADANLRLLAYQLEPLLAILNGTAARVLIADGVGLGKTIQAALVLRELTARGRAAHVLIAVPAGLRDQWQRELRTRVGLTSHIIDAHSLTARVRALPPDINPWAQPGITIASIDFIKQDVVLHGLSPIAWDAFVVDEAHALAPGTDRARAANLLAHHSRVVLLLTATPHDGDPATFDALCAVGRHEDPLVMFRRTRQDLGLPSKRRVRVLRVQPTPAERHLHDLLSRYMARVTREPNTTAPASAALAMTVLQKRASSSAWSLLRSLERRLSLLDADASCTATDAQPPVQRRLPFTLRRIDAIAATAADAAEAEIRPAVDADASEDDEPPLASLSAPGLLNTRAERAWLMLLIRAARRAAQCESKLMALRRLLRRLREPAIVYTEYRDTLTHIATAGALPQTVLLHGGLPREAREDALRAFAAGRAHALLATDAAGEGLNLQQRCRVVINVELPWNPNRLEQRIGRVDRLGQTKTVHAIHLVSANTTEAALLDTLTARMATITTALADSSSGSERSARASVSAQARECVRKLEERRRWNAAAARDDLLIALDTRAPWLAKTKARRPIAGLPPGTLYIWRTRLRFADASTQELITPIHVSHVPPVSHALRVSRVAAHTPREPWPVPAEARDAMRATLDARARAAIEKHEERERPFQERIARRDRAIAQALHELHTHAAATAATAADARQPLLFTDIARDRAAREPRDWLRQASPPNHAAATAAAADAAAASFEHSLLLILSMPRP